MHDHSMEECEDHTGWYESQYNHKPTHEVISDFEDHDSRIKVSWDGSVELVQGNSVCVPEFQANVSPDGAVVVNIKTLFMTPGMSWCIPGNDDFTLSPDDAENLGNMLIAASKVGFEKADDAFKKMAEEDAKKEADDEKRRDTANSS